MSDLPRLGQDTLQTRAAFSNEIWEARRQAARDTADRFETVRDPDRVPIEQGREGFRATQGFFDRALPREAAHSLDPMFPRQELGPSDVERTPEGEFAPREPVRRQRAAFEFEDDTPLDEVDPDRDVIMDDGGFGLAEPRQRDIAAHEFDPQFPDVEVGRDDIEARDDGFAPRESVQREQVARDIEAEQDIFGTGALDPADDIRAVDGGFGLAADPARKLAAADLDAQFPDIDVRPDDVMLEPTAGGGYEAIFETEVTR